ncbi:uncharacterized protein BXZ73DRAFT_102184 [Epithele typhae]|uniref:uncharacterized protein n=1 Tax=Epithele typhae TaxID=378194 RepID=UPI002008C7AA|nr:uncharacterized protein BXZ73DRAFT_102184 [Epithele typhae]KAH9929032.1 hypothetical protein BXZ73DRAFT_102184 [Epithele typhae]
MSKVVFVGNVPYNMAEEQLIDVFKSVGQVVGLRLVFDRDTGKPKGYGFCEFADHETASSAVRNLNGYEVGGRPLRIDLADSDPFLEGKTTVHGEIVDGGETRAQWRERHERERRDRERDHDRYSRSNDPNAFLANLPKGVPLPPGSNASDAISHVLATTDPSRILEVLAQMKAFVITHPEQARALLASQPQLGYALFQALLLHKIVDPAILNVSHARCYWGRRPSARPPQAPTPAPYAPPPNMYGIPPPVPAQHQMPPPNMYAQPSPQMPPPPTGPAGYYRPPPSLVPPVPVHAQQLPQQPPPNMYAQPPPPVPAAPAAAPDLGQQQRDMLMQVLSLTPEQLNGLPPKERDQIMQLRRQFGVQA